MRQIRETLRLNLQAGLSYNEVGRALKIVGADRKLSQIWIGADRLDS